MRYISIVVVVMLVLSPFAGIALAQEGTSTPTPGDEQASPTTTQTPTTTPTATPTETPEPTKTSDGSGDDSDTNVSRDDLWKMFKDSGSKEITERSIVMQVGPTVTVTKYEFDESSGTVTVWFASKVTTSVTVTDASALDASRATSKGQSRIVQIPRTEKGERIRITFPATVASDGNQRITFAPGDGWVYQLSNKKTGGGSTPLDKVLSLWYVYMSLFVAGIGSLWYLRGWFNRQSIDGPPVNEDGVELPDSTMYGDFEVIEGDGDDE